MKGRWVKLLIYNARKHELYQPFAQMKYVMTGGKYNVSEIGYWKNSNMVIIISFQEYNMITSFQEY